ncbi:MAG: hypothetical protein ABIJ96_01135 [Elusimicrobiota bacterium]
MTRERVIPGWTSARRATAWAAACWFLLLALYSLHGYPWSNLLQSWLPAALGVSWGIIAGHGLRLAALAWISGVLLGTGELALCRLRLDGQNPWERGACAYALGYGLWGTALFLLGLAGLWLRPLLPALLCAASIPAYLGLSGLAARWRADGGLFPAGLGFRLAACALAAVWLLHLPSSLMPETFYDAQGYHLGLPELYLQRGRITPTPENSYSGIPSIPMMLFGLGLTLDRWGMAAQLVHSSCLLWAGLAVAGLTRRLVKPEQAGAGWAAAAVFALTPVVTSESYRVSVGLEGALFYTLCFSALAAASAAPAGRGRRDWLLLCGCYAGFAMASKYPAWILPGVLGAGMFYQRFRRMDKGEAGFTVRDFALVAAASLALLAPWVGKNIAFYDNPIYPFLHERLVPDSFFLPDWRTLSVSDMKVREVLLTAHGLKTFFLRPWVFTRHAQEAGAAIGPFYLGLLPLLFCVRLSGAARLLAVLCLLSWLPINTVSAITRYFMPVLAPLCAVGTAAACAVPEARLRRVLGWAAAAVLLVSVAAYMTLGVKRWGNINAMTGGRDRWEYLSHVNHLSHYPTPPHAGFGYLHAQTPEDAKVLIFGDMRQFPLRRDRIASSPDQVALLELWANRSGSARELRRRFAAAGVSYVLVNHAEIYRTRRQFRFSPQGKRVLDEFWARYTRREFHRAVRRDYWVDVFRILDEADADRPHPVHDLWEGYKVSR